MPDNGNGLRNVIIAALMTGAVAFFSGYALSSVRDKDVIEDHEARLRLLEKTNYQMAADIKAIREKIEGYDGQR